MRNNIKSVNKDKVIDNLTTSKLIFVVDRLLFLYRLHLILAYFIVVIENEIIAKEKFITIAVIDYRYPYATELYRILAI